MRRALPAVVGVALAVAAVAAVFLFVTGRDDSTSRGQREPGELQPRASSGPAEVSGDDPPTSGTHEPRMVTRDRPITDDSYTRSSSVTW